MGMKKSLTEDMKNRLNEREREQLEYLLAKAEGHISQNYFEPERDDEYFAPIFDGDWRYVDDLWEGAPQDEAMLIRGLCFGTEQEALDYCKMKEIEMTLFAVARKYNQPINWSDKLTEKYVVMIKQGVLCLASVTEVQFPGAIYFSSIEIAKQALAELLKEHKEEDILPLYERMAKQG